MNKNDFIDLSDRFILVTGASSGIGRQSAIMLSGLGARLVLVARREDKLLETKSMLSENERGGHFCYVADLCNLDDIEKLMGNITSDVGILNGMVYAAGIGPVRPYNVSSPQYMQEVMQINFFAFYETVRQFVKKKNSENGSKIVAISSCASIRPGKGQDAYAASKAAMEASILCLAQELMHRNININSIRPGFVNTDMTQKWTKKKGVVKMREEDLVKQPLGVVEPEEIAGMVAYLMSPFADRITGRGFDIEGGRCCRE